MRFVIFSLGLLLCVSCEYFSSEKNKRVQELDTIVNFTNVDVSPTFIKCKDLMDAAKNNCFRKNLHQKISSGLLKNKFIIEEFLEETIYLNLLINKKGLILFKSVECSETITEQLPQLDSILRATINKLPKLYPAIKRGVPVTTQYQLPIKITSNIE